MPQTMIRTFVVVSVLSLCACSPDGGPPQPTASEIPSASPAPTMQTPRPDPTTTAPGPSPSPPSLPPGPGHGDAELAIMVKPSDSQPAINYTLTCRNGAPTDESQHPSAAKACEALKNNPEVLIPQPRGKDVVCTQQYGGPQTATVTGMVDGVPVDISFALRDGCEISQWNAAESILGPTTDL
ncbi:SSI family serine proteinase inhibitor [Pseudarthrobacter sp. H3Y2-7]|nr:SSI family serine proteinase inhibitor [Pseudarthrobacter sp. H3Y2-7]MDE8669959.1 SSI family serine proteinase inhibitor [Pseudarthrobacter sp. H3Y2-7]